MQPLDVIAISPRRRQFQIASLAKCLIGIENLDQQRGYGAGIEQQVVKAPGEDVFSFANAEQRHPHQRWHTQLETVAPLRLQIRVQTALLLVFRQTVPVLLFEMKAHVAMHLLPRLRPSPMESRPQNRVPFHGAFPRLVKSGHVYVLRQRGNHLLDVHAGVWRRKAVEQHALLHGRKRITLFDAVPRLDLVVASHIGAKNSLRRNPA